jgi:hypothetical protein
MPCHAPILAPHLMLDFMIYTSIVDVHHMKGFEMKDIFLNPGFIILVIHAVSLAALLSIMGTN